jgi:hypothetical protein
LREVGASIDAAEWVLLGELARGANQLKGKDRPMVLPADKLPTELRYPNQRFGVELAWDERGQPHVSPQAVPVFPGSPRQRRCRTPTGGCPGGGWTSSPTVGTPAGTTRSTGAATGRGCARSR